MHLAEGAYGFTTCDWCTTRVYVRVVFIPGLEVLLSRAARRSGPPESIRSSTSLGSGAFVDGNQHISNSGPLAKFGDNVSGLQSADMVCMALHG